MEKLNAIIQYLLEERNEMNIDIPTNEEEAKRLYRALVNMREPKEIPSHFLKLEEEYLQDELRKKEVTDVDNIPTIREQLEHVHLNNADKICLWQGDITKLKIDAIVNAANSAGLRMLRAESFLYRQSNSYFCGSKTKIRMQGRNG